MSHANNYTFYVHNDPDTLLVVEILKSGWVWELWDGNTPVAASTRSYTSRSKCEEAVHALKDAFQAPIKNKKPGR